MSGLKPTMYQGASLHLFLSRVFYFLVYGAVPSDHAHFVQCLCFVFQNFLFWYLFVVHILRPCEFFDVHPSVHLVI